MFDLLFEIPTVIVVLFMNFLDSEMCRLLILVIKLCIALLLTKRSKSSKINKSMMCRVSLPERVVSVLIAVFYDSQGDYHFQWHRLVETDSRRYLHRNSQYHLRHISLNQLTITMLNPVNIS